MFKPRTALALITSTLLLLCVSFNAVAQDKKKLTFYYIDNGNTDPTYAFWPVVYKGIADATALLAPLGVEVIHQVSMDNLNIQTDLLRKAIATNPDGLVTTMTDPEALTPILQPLVDRGVPIMAANAEDPSPQDERFPCKVFYGSDTGKTGTDLANAVIKQIRETGADAPKVVLFLNHFPKRNLWEKLFRNFGEVLSREYGTKTETLATSGMATIKSYLAKHPEVDVVCGQGLFIHYVSFILPIWHKQAGRDVYLASVDVMPDIVQDIKDGKVVAASDEEQYLQGFLPLMDLYLYAAKSKIHPLNTVFTGPIIWDKSNVDSIAEEINTGYR